MAETPTTTTVVNASAAIAIGGGVSNSEFAKSLLSASFDQIVHGQFNWMLSDIITLLCTSIVIANFVITRLEKRRAASPKERHG